MGSPEGGGEHPLGEIDGLLAGAVFAHAKTYLATLHNLPHTAPSANSAHACTRALSGSPEGCAPLAAERPKAGPLRGPTARRKPPKRLPGTFAAPGLPDCPDNGYLKPTNVSDAPGALPPNPRDT